MNNRAKLSTKDWLRLTYALAQGALLGLLLMIVDSWLPSNGQRDLALVGFFMPLVTGFMLLFAKGNLGIKTKAVLAFILLLSGLLGIVFYYHLSLLNGREQYGAAHYFRLSLVMGCAVLAWIRGFRLIKAELTAKRVVIGMQWGLVVIGALLFIAAQAQSSLSLHPLCMAVFLLFSFVSLWLAQSGDLRTEKTVENGRYSGIIAFAFGVCSVGLLAMVLWSLAELGLMEQVKGPVGKFSELFTWLVAVTGQLVLFIVSFLGVGNNSAVMSQKPDLEINKPSLPINQPPLVEASSSFGLVFMVVFFAVTLAFLGFAFYRFFMWIMARKKEQPTIDKANVTSGFQMGFWVWLKVLANNLLKGILGKSIFLQRFLYWGKPLGIEHYYGLLLLWAAKRGLPRKPCQTPEEFRKHLALVAPDLAQPFKTITQDFVIGRYGMTQALESASPEVMASWKKIRTSKALPRKSKGFKGLLKAVGKSLTR